MNWSEVLFFLDTPSFETNESISSASVVFFTSPKPFIWEVPKKEFKSDVDRNLVPLDSFSEKEQTCWKRKYKVAQNVIGYSIFIMYIFSFQRETLNSNVVLIQIQYYCFYNLRLILFVFSGQFYSRYNNCNEFCKKKSNYLILSRWHPR